jgi:hypothetical protein
MFTFKKQLDTFEIQLRMGLKYKQLRRKSMTFTCAEKKALKKSEVTNHFII